jgi:two-component system, response regulator RegA
MPSLESRSVLIIDDEPCPPLGPAFQRLGYETWQVTEPAHASACAVDPPALIVTELRVAGHSVFDFRTELCARYPDSPVVIATRYPSIATAVQSVRAGFTGYVAKPVAAQALLQLVAAEAEPLANAEASWPTLDRTIWEYINQVYAAAGSMSEAARRLGIDRCSLRRMLTKYPPPR